MLVKNHLVPLFRHRHYHQNLPFHHLYYRHRHRQHKSFRLTTEDQHRRYRQNLTHHLNR
jgi:hypothetical protein